MWREKLPISASRTGTSRTGNLFSASHTGNLLMKSIIFAIVFTIYFGLLAQNEYSCTTMHLKGEKQTFQTPIPDKCPEIVRREITYYD